eukprot:3980000-Pleurochrysis_carterae.AAC.2
MSCCVEWVGGRRGRGMLRPKCAHRKGLDLWRECGLERGQLVLMSSARFCAPARIPRRSART